jgi:NAD(P)-dependent dehydrogenase (short-subunit alcohol dehydrogenase family)
MDTLEGKVCAITAGTRGIGRSIAEAFLKEGASVVVNGRNETKGLQAVQEMGAGSQLLFVAGDVTRRTDVDKLIDETIDHFGRLDILVLNAGGVNKTSPIVDMSDEEWAFEINFNLNHTFWGIRKAFQHMIPRQYGRIITMSSIEGKLGKAGIAGYAANKHGIIGLTKAAAQEVGELGITVNALCPGIVLTDAFYESGPLTIQSMNLPDLDALARIYYKDSAIQRPNTGEEVAAMAVFLASDIAAGITGSAMNVDGGTSPY